MNTALNSDFYRSEQLYNRSDVWAYRYATEEEINANFFHGQDEPYSHLGTGSRRFTHLSLQTGGHCETSCCGIKNRAEYAVSHPDNFRSTKELSKPGKDIAPHTLSWHTVPFPR